MHSLVASSVGRESVWAAEEERGRTGTASAKRVAEFAVSRHFSAVVVHLFMSTRPVSNAPTTAPSMELPPSSRPEFTEGPNRKPLASYFSRIRA
jgi:hypothetical protein